MPTYEYRCTSCSEHLEIVQSFKDEALTECPNCGGPLRKVFGSIGIVFKGGGFYKTDSRPAAAKSDKGDKAGKSESTSTPAPSSSSSSESSSSTSSTSTSSPSSSTAASA